MRIKPLCRFNGDNAFWRNRKKITFFTIIIGSPKVFINTGTYFTDIRYFKFFHNPCCSTRLFIKVFEKF
uniref:Uncharacterized protein n=1 Tax=Siphoviridae sp. ct8NQ14 TaxID=2825363 RepID=A0A8S5PM21_9CAUD|nr:MAG TPA: hypothetical protein [Siphoviridae sp. ct8NQ14]